MSLLSRVFEKLSGVKDWIVNKIDDIKWWLTDKLGSTSYSGTTVQESVDVDKVLARFKEALHKAAEDVEKKAISVVMSKFDIFIQENRSVYPDVVESIKKKQRELSCDLEGSIISYSEKHISENDPEFQELLQMQPGDEKKQALDEKIDEIVFDAQENFAQELSRYMTELYTELSERINSNIDVKEAQLNEEMSSIKELTDNTGDKENNLKKHEDCRLVLAEIAACITSILNQCT